MKKHKLYRKFTSKSKYYKKVQYGHKHCFLLFGKRKRAKYRLETEKTRRENMILFGAVFETATIEAWKGVFS